jgi:hypothetical protein
MGISVDQMRKQINELYDGNFLRIFEMPVHQVIAIYYQKLNSGAFDKAKRIKKNNKGKSNEQVIYEQEHEDDYYYQYSIFDYAGKDKE